MKTFGVVAEYNPFHLGHEYLLSCAREAGATHIVAVMSGDFVQRAEPAFMGKFARAKAAVRCGVDLVIELPTQYATASSERFAYAGVYLLKALGVVDMQIFGSECADLELLCAASEAVCDERVIARTKELCESGMSYPAAREKAAGELFASCAPALCAPNDLLCVEYLKAMRRLGVPFEPLAVARKGARHDAREPLCGMAGAQAIRQKAAAEEPFSNYLPENSAQAVKKELEAGAVCFGYDKIERLLLHKLRSMSREQLRELPDTTGGLGDRLYAAARESGSANELFEKTKTKRYTMSRVKRAALCGLLDVDEGYFFDPPYVRVLAIGARGGELLQKIKKNCVLPLSHDLRVLSQENENCALSAALSERASALYAMALETPAAAGAEYTTKLYREEQI